MKALHDPASIGRIADEEYGLIAPGQRSIVVLPGANGSSGRGTPDPLADNPIPSSDLLPSDAILGPSARTAQPIMREPSFWRRVLSSLEFWHSLF